MCRFALYLGPRILISSLVTEPKNSIIHQSFHAKLRDEPLNGDGFGLSWFVPEISAHPATFKSVSPAWSNENLHDLARVTLSDCILAHVRAATPGSAVSHFNCHPFTDGPWAFMHNGDVAGFAMIRRKLLSRLSDRAFQLIKGSTDSEHLFALFLDFFEGFGEGAGNNQSNDPDQGVGVASPASVRDRMVGALKMTIEAVEELRRDSAIERPAYLNLAVSNGRDAVVTRYVSPPFEKAQTLFLHTGTEYICKDNMCLMVEPEHGQGATLIVSEPLSEDPGWREVPVNHVVVATLGEKAQIHSLFA